MRAMEKPSTRSLMRPMNDSLEPDQFDGKTEPVEKHCAGECHQHCGENRTFNESEFAVGQSRGNDQHNSGHEQANTIDKDAESECACEHEQQWPPADRAYRF